MLRFVRVMFGILGAPLFREHAYMGGGYCDFKLKLGAEPLPCRPSVHNITNRVAKMENTSPLPISNPFLKPIKKSRDRKSVV